MMLKKSDMRTAQVRVSTRMFEYDEGLAVVPMGGGKTCAAMTAIDELIAEGVIRCAVVLAPKKVAALVWAKEHKEWEHLQHLRISLVAGNPKQREHALWVNDAHIYVVGIDNVEWFLDEIAKAEPGNKFYDMLVIDEMSKFKNPSGKRAKRLQKERKKFGAVWGLTGTPRPNGYEDLFRQLSIISNERIWGRSFHRWREERFMALDYNGYNWVIRPEWIARTRKDAAAYSITIGDKDMPELPELTPVFHWVDLPPKALDYYKAMERKLLVHTDTDTIMAANAAVASGKLSQIAQGFMYSENGDIVDIHTEKDDMLVELVECMDENVLISYEFRRDLQVMQALWPGLPYLGAGVSDAKADEHQTRWNSGDLRRLALHPASAGHGLNLQKGGHQFILYGMPWSAELYDQMLKRFHRPGQTEKCFAHHILARNTVDEAKYNRVVGKMTEQDAFRMYLDKVQEEWK